MSSSKGGVMKQRRSAKDESSDATCTSSTADTILSTMVSAGPTTLPMTTTSDMGSTTLETTQGTEQRSSSGVSRKKGGSSYYQQVRSSLKGVITAASNFTDPKIELRFQRDWVATIPSRVRFYELFFLPSLVMLQSFCTAMVGVMHSKQTLIETLSSLVCCAMMFLLLSSRNDRSVATGKLLLHAFRLLSFLHGVEFVSCSGTLQTCAKDDICMCSHTIRAEHFFLIMFRDFVVGALFHPVLDERLFSCTLLCILRLASVAEFSDGRISLQTVPADEWNSVCFFIFLGIPFTIWRYSTLREQWLQQEVSATLGSFVPHSVFQDGTQTPPMEGGDQLVTDVSSAVFDDASKRRAQLLNPMHIISSLSTDPGTELHLFLGADDYFSEDDLQKLRAEIIQEISKLSRRARTLAPDDDAVMNRYRKTGVLGEGGLGSVDSGIDISTGETVAIKQSKHVADKIMESALSDEASILKLLSHPNIVHFKGFGEQQGAQYLVLECCDGNSLRCLLKGGPVDEESAKHIMAQLLSAVAYIHLLGIAHIDVKPGNILFRKGFVKLADWGSATWMNEAGRSQKRPHSKPYVPPEHWETGKVSRAMDVWACGCCFVESLTLARIGEQFFRRTKDGHYTAKPVAQRSTVALPTNLSEEAREFALQCLKINASRRPPAYMLLENQYLKGEGRDYQRSAIPLFGLPEGTAHLKTISKINSFRDLIDAILSLDRKFRDPLVEEKFVQSHCLPQFKASFSIIRVACFQLCLKFLVLEWEEMLKFTVRGILCAGAFVWTGWLFFFSTSWRSRFNGFPWMVWYGGLVEAIYAPLGLFLPDIWAYTCGNVACIFCGAFDFVHSVVVQVPCLVKLSRMFLAVWYDFRSQDLSIMDLFQWPTEGQDPRIAHHQMEFVTVFMKISLFLTLMISMAKIWYDKIGRARDEFRTLYAKTLTFE